MIVEIKKFQEELKVVANRPALAKFLFELSQMVSSNGMENEPLGVVVGFVGVDKVEVAWHGGLSHDQIRAVAGQISETLHASRWQREPRNILKQLRDNEDERQQLQRDYEDSHPWLCEHEGCKERFKTERGTKQHEARCWRKKRIEPSQSPP